MDKQRNFVSMKFAEFKNWLIFVLIICIIDASVLLNVSFFRPILGFVFLTFISGTLLIRIFDLNEAENIEKLLLAIGLSLSFVLIFGLFVNNLLLASGHKTPLSTVSVMISFNTVSYTHLRAHETDSY